MVNTPSIPSVRGRMILTTVLLVSLVAGAGCSTTDDYTTEIDEPTTGAVIGNFSVVDINELDGAQYELQHRLNASEETHYKVEVYDLTNESAEIAYVSSLNPNESIYRNDVAPPWDEGEKRRYELRVINGSDNTTVDTITFAITKGSS